MTDGWPPEPPKISEYVLADYLDQLEREGVEDPIVAIREKFNLPER